jgi:hypothetical protein
MIKLYSGSGSQEVQVLDKVVPDQAWTIEKRSVVRLLEAKGYRQAATILESTPLCANDDETPTPVKLL